MPMYGDGLGIESGLNSFAVSTSSGFVDEVMVGGHACSLRGVGLLSPHNVGSGGRLTEHVLIVRFVISRRGDVHELEAHFDLLRVGELGQLERAEIVVVEPEFLDDVFRDKRLLNCWVE